MDTTSIWESAAPADISFPTLNEDLHVDVAIIGGGITALTLALELAEHHKKITILETAKIGGGTTGNSTGNLYIAVQPYYQNIRKKFNQDTVKTIAESRQLAIDYIEGVVQKFNIECHFARRLWYMYTNNKDNISFLEKEVKVLQEAGIAIETCNELDIPFSFKKAALMPNQARFNPYKYTVALAKLLNKHKDCQIFENTQVISIKEEKKECVIVTKAGTVYAKKLVIATHTPKGINLAHFLEAPYRSYVVAAKLKGVYPQGHYWDLDKPNYITSTHSVFSNKIDRLLVAGNHHKTGQDKNAKENYKKIEAYITKHYDVSAIEYHWSAQHYQTIDGIPYIGLASPRAKHSYIATGFFADGLVYGILAGVILADVLIGKNKNADLIYKLTRFKIRALPTFIKESANVFLQYLKDVPINIDTKELKNIKADEGKIIRIAGQKYGAYRDKHGKLQIVSAVCTHMKCIVNWNNAEKTWDCPCHGSRFSVTGEVLEGPAYNNLKKLELSKKDKI